MANILSTIYLRIVNISDLSTSKSSILYYIHWILCIFPQKSVYNGIWYSLIIWVSISTIFVKQAKKRQFWRQPITVFLTGVSKFNDNNMNVAYLFVRNDLKSTLVLTKITFRRIYWHFYRKSWGGCGCGFEKSANWGQEYFLDAPWLSF